MPEIGRRGSGGGRRREDWGPPGLKMHVKSAAVAVHGRTREQSDDVRGVHHQLHDGLG